MPKKRPATTRKKKASAKRKPSGQDGQESVGALTDPTTSDDATAMALAMIVEGKKPRDILQRLAAEYPKRDASAILNQVFDHLEQLTEVDPRFVAGFVMAGLSEIYGRAMEMGDLQSALRALKELNYIAKQMD